MATVLFIKREDLVKNSIISGNVDSDKFLPFVKLAQQIHIQDYLGTDLYNKLVSEIQGETISGHYLELLNNYVQPMLIHYAMVEYLPFASMRIDNGGVFRHESENSIVATDEEIGKLIAKHRDYAEYYATRMIDHLSYYADSRYKEYYTNSEDDVNPSKDSLFHNWNI